jgi:hypothetical protein
LRARSRLEIQLRQPEALRLAQFEFDGFTVGDSLPNLGIGFERDRDGFFERDRTGVA